VGKAGLEPTTSNLSGLPSNQMTYMPIVVVVAGLEPAHLLLIRQAPSPFSYTTICRNRWIRTIDLLNISQKLYQLSYIPKYRAADGIQTHNLLIKSQLRYSIAPRQHFCHLDENRTHFLLL
jgi:hypothetical protein